MGITVSAEGHVHCGNNEWFSLDKIQEAVLRKQNPTLAGNRSLIQPDEKVQVVGNCGYEEMARALGDELAAIERQQHMSNHEEPHLPLPKLGPFKSQTSQQPTPKPKPTFNDGGQEHLALPHMNFQRRD